MRTERIFRLNALLQKEIGNIILHEVEFPPQTLVTVSGVETSPDLQRAKVYISIIPSARELAVAEILQHRIFRIQEKLNARLRMRPVPKIEFAGAQEIAAARKVEELLEELKTRRKTAQ